MEFEGYNSTKSLRDCSHASRLKGCIGVGRSIRTPVLPNMHDIGPQSAKADFVLLLPRIHSPG
jgi:hypothetical protein